MNDFIRLFAGDDEVPFKAERIAEKRDAVWRVIINEAGDDGWSYWHSGAPMADFTGIEITQDCVLQAETAWAKKNPGD
jgi:hypothetical protein